MAKKLLFTEDAASDPVYVNVRSSRSDHMRDARQHCEALWEIYERHADKDFRIAIRKEFHAKYWEMHLAVALIEQGHTITCPKPGPDVGIEVDGLRIWFEATTATRGQDGAADQVEEIRTGGAFGVPNEKILLRYVNSISGKCKNQYAKWLERGIVNSRDAFVVALNPRNIGYEYADVEPPRILQVAFAIGSPYVTFDRDTMAQVDYGYSHRESIAKASGENVETGLFDRRQYKVLSGLLCSRVDVVNRPQQLGMDFQLVGNPNADVQLPEAFRLKGIYYRIERDQNQYSAIPERRV